MDSENTRKNIISLKSLKNTFKTDKDIFDDIDFNKKIESEIDTLCKLKKKKKILILSGGGTKGILFVGSLKFLSEKHMLDYIDTYVGTSIGALFVLLLYIGYSIDELYKIVKFFDVSSLVNIDLSNLIDKYSIINYDGINTMVTKFLKLKNIDSNITLLDLYKLTKKKIIFATVCITTKKIEYISYETYPEMNILTAVQMTLALPFIFPPVPYNGKHYIDGGILDNLNVCIFHDRLDEVIGLNIVTEYETVHNIDGVPMFLYSILILIFLILNKTYDEEIYKNSIYNINIDKLTEAKTLNINIDWKEKKKLINYGYEFVKNNFKN